MMIFSEWFLPVFLFVKRNYQQLLEESESQKLLFQAQEESFYPTPPRKPQEFAVEISLTYHLIFPFNKREPR